MRYAICNLGLPMKAPSSILFIRNMVCDRCVRVVREELTKLGLDVRRVELGEAEIADSEMSINLDAIRRTLEENGFELIEDRKRKSIEAVKLAIVKLVHHRHDEKPLKLKLSAYITREVGQEYHGLSALFSSTEGVTIEQYYILQRIEKAKELLKYGELTLSEIAWQMGYSSVQHLSGQFRQVTGMTPSEFRKMGKAKRVGLDKVGA